MPSLPICVITDLTISLPIYSPHNFAPAAPPVPPPMPAVPMSPAPASAMEFPATMLWPPGNVLLLNKYSTTVTHKRLGIIQAGHDLGVMLAHIQMAPAPNNVFTPVHSLFSSRKVSFNSSSVKANGLFVGFAGLIAPMPTPMLVCGEPLSFPMGEVPTRWANNVWAGFSYMDLALGAMNMAVKLMTEKAFMPKGRLGPLKKVVKDKRLGKGGLIYNKMFPVQTRKQAKAFLSRQVAGVVSGAVTAFVQGEGSGSFTLGSSFASVTLTVARDSAGATAASLSTKVPGLSESVGYKTGKGPTVSATANWGTGGGKVETSSSSSKQTTHNALEGNVLEVSR
jgi:hypothetical protein